MKMHFRLFNIEEELFQEGSWKITEESRLEMIKLKGPGAKAAPSSVHRTLRRSRTTTRRIKIHQAADDVNDYLFAKGFTLVDGVSEMIHVYEGVLFDDTLNVINERINIIRMRAIFQGSKRSRTETGTESVADDRRP
jgi:hypothetical protein